MNKSCLFILNDPFYAFTVDTLGHFVNQIGRIGQGPGVQTDCQY